MTPPVYRSRRVAFGWAVALGLFTHGAIVAWGALTRASLPALPPIAGVSFAEIALVSLPLPEPGQDDDGGGSELPGTQPSAEGAEVAPPAPKPAAIAPTPLEAESPPAPPESDGERETLEHGNADVDEADDLFALDALLTDSEDAPPLALKFEAAAGLAQRNRYWVQSDAGQASTRYGSLRHWSGLEGGAGGMGARRSPAEQIRGASVFGGESGAFAGSVCFIPERTPSIRSIGACKTELVLYTDVINVPSTHFETGFPGISERTEWFSILYQGGFQVARSGEYMFRLASDDGSVLRIDGQVIVDNDGIHGPVAKRANVQLSAGVHSLDLRYFQGPRALVALQLWVTPPGQSERLFGASF